MTTTAGRKLSDRPAVVLSSSKDASNVEPVVTALAGSGLAPIVVRMDDVVTARQQLVVRLDGGRARVEVDGAAFWASDVACAWWRKPHWLRIERSDPLTGSSLEREVASAVDGFAALIPEAAWLNTPAALRNAAIKLPQLAVAAEAGFEVPATVMTNRWEDVRALGDGTEIVFKSFRGGVQATDGNRIAFTTPVPPSRVAELAARSTPFPGVFQQRVRGAREWRVTVVGAQVLEAAIDLDPGLVDWRRHQLSGGARFVRRELPDSWAAACVRVTRALRLGYGAIDLIEDPEGRMHFLECNPNGQYGWLEHELGLPVSQLIASELLAIAERRSNILQRAGR